MRIIARLKGYAIRCRADLHVRRAGRPEGLPYTVAKNAAKSLRYGWVVLVMSVMACSGGAGGLGMSCGAAAPVNAPASPPPSTSAHLPIGQLPPIDLDALLTHTKKLSSDAFEGRAPGTKGE